MKKVLAAAFLSVLVATPALAQSAGKSYLALDVGPASYRGVKVAAGTYPDPGSANFVFGYRFADKVAAEIGYTSFGDSSLVGSGTSATVSASSFHANAVGNYAMSEKFDLLGLIGLANNSQKLAVSTGTTYSGSATGLMYGLGVQFKINQRFSVRALYRDYGSFGKFGATNGDMTATTFTVGGILNF